MAASDAAASPLPVRTNRYRRIGRHSSPHKLSVPSDAPVLVIAVPCSASPESEDLAAELAGLAGGSVPGASIVPAFLGPGKDHLTEVLGSLPRGSSAPPAVVVPLIAFPARQVSGVIASAIAETGASCLVADPLGPHPLLAEGLHQRLAEVGLARSSRVGRINIVAEADGVIVGAHGDEDVAGPAGVVAVLLASRLTIPVAPASLADPVGLKEAAEQLRAAGVARVAVAPCVIGPEAGLGVLDTIRAETGAQCAAPLGTHPCIAQLIAIRYGAALADPSLVGQPG
jgi:sirohydrochlorin ferrochelatase